jgi:hypothetical protein
MSFKVIVAGGRNFTDYKTLKRVLDYHFHKKIEEGCEIEIVSGNAKGADFLGEHYSRTVLNKEPTLFPAPWEDIKDKPTSQIGVNSRGIKYWKLAGYHRNGQMAEYADALVAFWDGKSGGTANMIEQARKHKLRIKKFIYHVK